MKNRKITTKYPLFFAVAAITAILCACSGKDEASSPETDTAAGSETEAQLITEYNIGFSDMGSSVFPWFLGTIEGCYDWMEDHGEEYNVKFNFDVQDSLADSTVMANNLNGMIADGKDGIIIFPTDDHTAVPILQEAASEGIRIILGDYAQTVDSEDDVPWETFISHDMRELGTAAGNLAVEYLNTLGKQDPLCLFITDPAWGDSSTERYEGFVMAVQSAYPLAEILVIQETGDRTVESTEALVSDFLSTGEYAERTFDIVSGHNDTQVLGAYNAFTNSGRDGTKFIGIAGDRRVITYLSEGNTSWLGEVLQDPVALGYSAADAMYHSLVLGESLPDEYPLDPPTIITADNISEYDFSSWSWLE